MKKTPLNKNRVIQLFGQGTLKRFKIKIKIFDNWNQPTTKTTQRRKTIFLIKIINNIYRGHFLKTLFIFLNTIQFWEVVKEEYNPGEGSLQFNRLSRLKVSQESR